MDNNDDSNDNCEKKQISITGQSNRYQIKKLTQEKKKDKKRVEIEKLNLSEEYFIFKKQAELINNINNLSELPELPEFSDLNKQDINASKIMLKQIEREKLVVINNKISIKKF